MKRIVVALIAVIATAGLARAETYTGLVVNKNGTVVIASPANRNQTIVNVMTSAGSEIISYAGKVVEVTGQLNPARAFPTLQSIESIKEVPAQ